MLAFILIVLGVTVFLFAIGVLIAMFLGWRAGRREGLKLQEAAAREQIRRKVNLV